jgi:dihydrolipoamide dehydrogenase
VTAPDGWTTTLSARHAVVVATGSSALLPDVPGLLQAKPWTSREAAAARTVPERLAVIGGGVVASEMATAFAALGSSVTVLARDGVLPLAEPFAGQRVTESLRKAGVQVLLGAEAGSVKRDGEGTVHITLTSGEQVEADELLVAVGRTPNTQDIGLDSVGLTAGSWLTVDDTLRVVGGDPEALAGRWLYAVGDVNRRVLLTHQGKYQARAVGDAIVARAKGEPVEDGPWGRHTATADERAVPQVVFTEPEVASVGLTAAAAEAAGITIRVVDYDLGAVAGAALHADGYQGQARMVVDEDRKVVVGFTLVGPDVAELLHAATVAIAGEVPLDRLWHAVPAFPTISEVWLRLLEAYGR